MLEQSSLKKEAPDITNELIIKKIASFLDPDFQTLGNLNIANKSFHKKLKPVWQNLINKYSSTLKNDYPEQYENNPSSLFVKRVWNFFKERLAQKAKETPSFLPQLAADFQYMQKELFNLINQHNAAENYKNHILDTTTQSFFLAHLSLYAKNKRDVVMLLENKIGDLQTARELILTHAVAYGHEETFRMLKLILTGLRQDESLKKNILTFNAQIAAEAERKTILLEILGAFSDKSETCAQIISNLRQEAAEKFLAHNPTLLLSNLLSTSITNPTAVAITECRVPEPSSVLFLKKMMEEANIKENPSANVNGTPIVPVDNPCCLQ